MINFQLTVFRSAASIFRLLDHISVDVDRFERFSNLELDKEAISDGCRSENPGIGGGF